MNPSSFDPIEDPFLDDQDLLAERLLSRQDATRMYERGEITKRQLMTLIENLPQELKTADQEKSTKNVNFLILVGLILFLALCLLLAITNV